MSQCPKRRMSPVREILCYTSALDAQLLADSVCSCTTLVHQHYDVRNLSVSRIVDLRKSLKEMHPPLQFVISIYDPAMMLRNSAMVRQAAVARIIAVMKEVDGVEMNVTAGSKERLYNFVKSLRDEMIRKSYDRRIFLALPSKPEDLAKQFDVKELAKYIDLFTLSTDYMTDEDGAFVTFHPSRLIGLFDMLNTDSLVDLISELGAPREKIMTTLPASAYRFTLKHEAENAPRSKTTEKEPTSIDRKQLCEAINDGEWIVERDEDLTAPYAFQNKTWIAFEDKISVGIKGKYALLRDLAGLAVRNIENDKKTECEMPLTEEIYRSFTEFKRKTRQAVLNALEDELHQTQFSYPNRARTSSFRVIRVVDTEGHIKAVRENTQTEFVCRRQGYFVHPKSCNRFYRCVKFNQQIDDYSVFEFDCPAGLSFDERTEVCVWPGSLPQGSPCPGSSEIAPVAPKRFECSQPGYYADPQNCRWFFACMDLGESELMAFEFRCPYGLVFDEKRLVCEWPWLVPACSESGSAYTRTEYNYGGYTVAGSSAGGARGDGYITGGLPEYSVTAGHSNVGYSETTGTGVHGANYFTGSTAEYLGKHTSGADAASGYAGSSAGPIAIDYSKPSGYGGTISSIPTYTGASGIHVGSISPAEESSTGYSASSGKTSNIGYTVSTGHRAGSGYSGGYTGPSGGITTGFSGSTAGGYSGNVGGSRLTGGDVTYSSRPVSSYSVAGGYTGGVDANINPIVSTVTYPKTSGYFASTESPGSSVDIGRVDSAGSKFVGSTNLYTGSSAFNAGGHSVSTDIYSGATSAERQPSFDKTGSSFGIGLSYPGATGGSSTQVYQGSIGAEYSKATSGILQGSTSSGRVSATGFDSGASKSVSGHTDVTIADSKHFVSGSVNSVPSSGVTGASSTGVGYNDEEGYTVPVVLVHGEPIYPLPGITEAGTRDYTGTPGILRGYGKPGLTRPHLNISIFGNEISTGYDVQKGATGTTVTGSGVQGNIHTDDSISGTIFTHGNVPGTISSPAINQGAVLTGGVQPGYIAYEKAEPGYVIRDGLKTVDIGAASPGTLIYGSPTPAISVSGPSTSSVVSKGDITPGIVISGHTAPGVSIGNSVQSGNIDSSTGKSYVSQAETTYHGVNGAATRGCSSGSWTVLGRPTRPQNYQTDVGCGIGAINTAYDTGKYSESDVPDYRPTSATLPDSIVSGGRIEGTGGVIFGSTLQGSTTSAPGYSLPTAAVFTPSGFTKTGLTRTGITTAVLGGGGSYSVSTSERRPAWNPENISEKAFEGNVAGYTKTSSSSNAADLSVTLTPPGYSSTTPPSRVIVQSAPSSYSYPKPSIQLGTSGVTFVSSTISPIENNLSITSSKPFSINVYDGSLDNTGVAFGSKVPTAPDRRLSTPTISSVIYTTERPEIYKTTLFEAAKIPVAVSTVKPITGYKTVTVPPNIPVLTDDRFIQQTGNSQTASVSTSGIGLGASFQRTDFSGKKNHDSSLVSVYLPAKSTKPGVITSTIRYDIPAVTMRPDLVGVTYKKPSSFTYEGPSSITSPTTFRPSNVYYNGQGFSTASSAGTTSSGSSPTNLDISREKIDKLITNYDRGSVRYMPSLYDTTASSGFGSTISKLSSEKSRFSVIGSTVAITTPFGSTTSSYQVTTKSPEDKGKVIVKWSDLHPLLLGKLGAECTCKADPFATLRGPVRKLIASSKGKVDLGNYDESEIYVDLENNGSSEEDSTDYGDYPMQPYKISPHETTRDHPPSSSYLPVSSTTVKTRDFGPAVGFRRESSAGDAPFEVHLGFRTGRKLKDDVSPSTNSIAHEEDPDQIINSATDCARPGLFRHPSLCNKFYACHWDQWKKKFTLHIFNCPIHLTFDSKASACNWPSKGPACQDDNLLV
ncbi:mucin-22 isoform X2 [Polyergus mexicanus]|uniref:mucin-22 isoform X2 n=1 Tax=Polyergus mexicanus TaxID=615972 RepID=UPI0038B697FA